MKIDKASDAINRYLETLSRDGFHVQKLSVKDDGAVVFKDRSSLVAVALLPKVDIEGKKVLCVGANTGHDAFLCFGAGASEVTVLEMVPQLCSVASVLLMLCREDRDWCVVPGSIEDTRPEHLDGPFDVIYMPGVLYHLRSPIRALHRCYDLLADRGSIVIETMTAGKDTRVDSAVYYPVGHPTDYARGKNYPNYFVPTPAVAKSWILDAGFHSVEQVEGPNVRGAFVAQKGQDDV